MNWTMPYPCRSRSDSVRRINMSSEPGNESFFCALFPIPRILSLQGEITRVKFEVASPRAPDANRYQPQSVQVTQPCRKDTYNSGAAVRSRFFRPDPHPRDPPGERRTSLATDDRLKTG